MPVNGPKIEGQESTAVNDLIIPEHNVEILTKNKTKRKAEKLINTKQMQPGGDYE